MTDPQQARVEAGRLIVIFFCVIVMLISAATIILYNVRVGSDRLFSQSVRLALTLGLCVAIYRGAMWARAIGIALFLIGGVWFSWAGYSKDYAALSSRLIMAGYGAAYLLFAGALMFSRSVDVFMKHQRWTQRQQQDR